MRIVAIVALVAAGIAAARGQNPPIDSQSGARTMLALHSPATASGFGRIERYLLNESALRGRLAGLLTLITAREMNLTHEWRIHEGAARASGLAAAVIEVIRSNGPVEALSRDDALLIDFGRQLYRNRHVQSATFAALVDRLGRQGAFDAIMLLAYPAMAGVLERAVEPQPPQGRSVSRLPRIPGVGTPTGRPGEFVALPERPPLPRDVHGDSYYRFPLLARRDLDARSQDTFDRIVGPDRDTTPRGPVGMTFLSPELVEPVQNINTALRTNGVLGTRLAEIVIAATGREMNSQYQWTVHGAAAAAAGAGQDVLEAIRSDGRSPLSTSATWSPSNSSARFFARSGSGRTRSPGPCSCPAFAVRSRWRR
jgi:hypothetical protein